jgi:DNA-directed RNA polymerase sigma subunit (sigma70/sigma32)
LNKEYTLEEISQTIGLSRERIRQVSHHAIEKLSRSFSHCL